MYLDLTPVASRVESDGQLTGQTSQFNPVVNITGCVGSSEDESDVFIKGLASCPRFSEEVFYLFSA